MSNIALCILIVIPLLAAHCSAAADDGGELLVLNVVSKYLGYMRVQLLNLA